MTREERVLKAAKSIERARWEAMMENDGILNPSTTKKILANLLADELEEQAARQTRAADSFKGGYPEAQAARMERDSAAEQLQEAAAAYRKLEGTP